MEIYSQFRVIVAVAAVLLSFSKLESSSPTGQKRSEVAADHREPGNTVWETELFFQTSWTEGNRNSMELSHYMRVLTTFIYTKRHMYVTDNCCSCVASHKDISNTKQRYLYKNVSFQLSKLCQHCVNHPVSPDL